MPYIKKMIMHGFKSFARKTEIPLENSINIVVGPNGSGKSCHYDTLVKLSNGQDIKIGKLIEKQLKNSNQILPLKDGIYTKGEEIKIFSLNKLTGKQEIKPINNFIKRKGEEIFEIKTASGKVIKATGCHPVMTFKDGQIKSVIIRELQEDSLIASPRTLSIIPDKQYPKNLARLIGYLIGDGYLAKDRIEFVNQDKEVIEDYKSIINQYFKVNLRIRNDKNATRIYFRNKKAIKQIKNLFIKNHNESKTSKTKKIPKLLLSTNNNVIAQTLAGLYDTDGNIRKDIAVIEFCTKNNNLAKQMQDLLLRFNITSKIKQRNCYATNTANKTKRIYHYLYIYGQNNFQKFYNNIPLKINYKKEAIKNHLNNPIIPNPNLDILPKELNQKIRLITKLLGIKAKPLRKKYPFYVAYLENRCNPTSIGINKLIPLFEKKHKTLLKLYNNITINQNNLIICMDKLNLSGQYTSAQIRLNPAIINTYWRTNKFTPKQENLQNFYIFIKTTLQNRLLKTQKLLSTLKMISNSDIYWDKIVSIKKLPKEKYVYDLSIKDNHNFLANGLFVHNSNITDALCFVLGRISAKSMRATKSANLLFSGNKIYKGSAEASVEIIFDNSDKTFAIDSKEIAIKRIVRKNGQSIYKINKETKTRQEILELLAQAGVDPNGFNIVLQGEIQSLVKATSEERRKIIEEVAGISIYETRKHKSLRELEKSEEKLKEVSAVLKERNSYLKNLNKERQEAISHQKLETIIKRCKTTLLTEKEKEKEKEVSKINETIQNHNSKIEKIKKIIQQKNHSSLELQDKIAKINKQIQSSTSNEQETLYREISDLKADLAGLTVRRENFSNRIKEGKEKIENLKTKIENLNTEISKIQTSSPEIKKQQEQQKTLQEKLDKLEQQRRKFYILKSELSTTENEKQQKEKFLIESQKEIQLIEQTINSLFNEIKYSKSPKENEKIKEETKNEIEKITEKITDLEISILEKEKRNAILETNIKREEKLKEDIIKLKLCPICKQNVKDDHKHNISESANIKIKSAKKEIEKNYEERKIGNEKINQLKEKLSKLRNKINELDIDEIKRKNSEEKKEIIKNTTKKQEKTKKELISINEKLHSIKEEYEKLKDIEEKHDEARLSLQELSFADMDIDTEITIKRKEVNRFSVELKSTERDIEESEIELKKIETTTKEKEKEVEKKGIEEQKLYEKAQKFFDEKNKTQDLQKTIETDIIGMQHAVKNLEEKINHNKIQKAQFNAQIDSIKEGLKEIGNAEVLALSEEQVKEKLQKAQFKISRLGNVNMRALEVFDTIDKQVKSIQEKVETIQTEQEKIKKIIEEIDKKKKKSFLTTLSAINEYFTRNFTQLSKKGEVFLELEDKKDPFTGGLNILIKISRGRYFDITSLSGGEKTLVALSLIFAIQEYRPYCFYIFDEIDAALDKHNSELLAALIKKHITSGQYIIITHNDTLISEASNIYGVSMQENISKIISLKV